MCRGCCEYDVIHCKCPLQGSSVGYAVPCCRNAVNECDPCIIHPGCSIFENCKRCNNGTWGPRDDFFVKGKYCAECRPGWSGGDCLTCGGVIHKRQGHLVLESYPNNAHCEWTLKVDGLFTIDLRFMMLSLEFDHSCQYDYVEVRDGESLNSRVIGRYCGNERPPPIKSTGNSLHILFISDGYKNFDGFFQILLECISSPCLHDGTCIVDSSHSFHCACLAGYTGKRCEHVPDQNCGIPPKPEHGDHFLVYGPNDVLIAIQYFCYKLYKLNGTPQRTCLGNNTWSGTAPICVKALDTSVDSYTVKKKSVKFTVKYRQLWLPELYREKYVQPTQAPFTMPPLPQGFHHVYTHIEYECMSLYYQHFGSARRTCLKMGKWSGRHVSCSPVCGKLTNFDPQNPSETNWPWLAAIYRLPVASKLGKLSVAKTMGLVCSGALVNQRSVVVAAHCVTELGKLYPLDTAKIRVVLGKQYRSDLRVTKGLQRLRVSSITLHPNYDPLVLDSDVSILKLLDKARIGEYVLPICLPDARDTVEDSRQRMVTGWSLLPDQKAGDAEKARVGRVILGDVVQCEQQYASYGVPISVSENMLCGQQGSGAEQSNICPADTGGILILPPVSSGSSLTPPHGQGSQEWKLLGLVSFGHDSLNCNPELYTVYTHVSNFVSFIEENMT
uniref:Inactive serine protease PAMR1 n=1 Tax=Sinocyclocheilus rhinocerous TaxID=307959 RepID=A0A673LIR5_9TELE